MPLFHSRALLFLSAWLIASPAGANSEFGFALKGGGNAATLKSDNADKRYGLTGGLAGYLQWPLGSNLSLSAQVELLYAPRGAEAFFEGEYVGQFRQNYFDVVMAARPQVRVGPSSLYLLLGGGVNALLRASRENVSGAREDITGDLRRIDVALLAGAGVALHLPETELGPLRIGTFFLEARYDHGLVRAVADNDGFKNRVTSLMFGVSFALGTGAAKAPPTSPPTLDPSPAPVVGAAAAE